jgi:large conductance mechanosensitive channel
MRGNLVELAVALVIGTQFSNLVKQFVSSFVNPLLSLVGGTPNFGNAARPTSGIWCGRWAR